MLKKMIAWSMVGVACLGVAVMSGCEQTATVKEEKTVTTPEGSTTKTTETEVKKSGENPPATPE